MIIIQIIGLLLTGLFVVILANSLVKYRFKELTQDKIVFKRFWFYKPIIKLDHKTITEIYYCTLMDKPLSYVVETHNKKRYKISDKLEIKNMTSFAIRNNLTLLQDEAYHGGGISSIHTASKKGTAS